MDNLEFLRIVIKMAYLLDNSDDMKEEDMESFREHLDELARDCGFDDHVQAFHAL